MPNRVFAWLLFLSSYAPAFAIFAVRAFNRSWLLFWITLGLTVLPSLAFGLYVKVNRTGAPIRAQALAVEAHDADITAYVAAYLLPFVAITGGEAQDLIALALFLVFIGVVWVASDLLYLNPLLAIIGYHLYLADIRPIGNTVPPPDTIRRVFVLSRNGELEVGARVMAHSVGTRVYFDQEES